jgi:hypothetical protein
MRRLGDNLRHESPGERTPRAGEWRASDFDSSELEAWDRSDAAPFDLPNDAYAPYAPYGNAGRSGRGAQNRRASDDRDAAWETGTWDTGWAAGYQGSTEYAGDGEGDDFWMPGRRAAYEDDEDMLSHSFNTLAELGAVGVPMSRLGRTRLLLRRRPGAAAVLAMFLLGFMLTCCAPLIPILRLGYDVADASQRVNRIQDLIAGDPTQLINASKMEEMQGEIDGLQHDLYEINGVINVIGAPFGGASPTIQNYRLLARMGSDLASAADGGLKVAQTVLVPFQGGAISSDTGPGLTPDDIQQAREALATAETQVADAVDAYNQLDHNALPPELKPGSKYGKMLTLLPTAAQAIGELNTLLDAAPSLLGIGNPAYYLVMAMDTTELRPGGGFQGNYGVLTIEGGKQSKTRPLSLRDVYTLDIKYYHNPKYNPHPDPNDEPACNSSGPQPPAYYWWWPYRTFSCELGWGLRDSNLSADFPTNARTAMKIVSDAGNEVPNNGQLQGVIAFTPGLIKDLLRVTGPLHVGAPYNYTVNASNLEHAIHEFQLGGHKVKGSDDRKGFTHVLSSMLLDRLKSLHGSQLRSVVKVAQEALKAKDLQIYFNDPRPELILRQLGLSSEIATGEGDGFFVVDTNDGGNKANAFVTEHQTDFVTLLPDGGALHRLQIAVTYNKKGSVYEGDTKFQDYSDVQRTYLPADATILGYSGFNPPIYTPDGCGQLATSIIMDCSSGHILVGPVTASDVPGRSMVMGNLLVSCGPSPTYIDRDTDFNGCQDNPQSHTQTIYITWYTPNAFTMDADGHGTYSMRVERQPGNNATLTVYVSTSQLHRAQPDPNGNTPDLTVQGSNDAARQAYFTQLIKGAQKAFNGPLDQNRTIPVSF